MIHCSQRQLQRYAVLPIATATMLIATASNNILYEPFGLREILWLGVSACSYVEEYVETLPKTKNAGTRGGSGLQYYNTPPLVYYVLGLGGLKIKRWLQGYLLISGWNQKVRAFCLHLFFFFFLFTISPWVSLLLRDPGFFLLLIAHASTPPIYGCLLCSQPWATSSCAIFLLHQQRDRSLSHLFCSSLWFDKCQDRFLISGSQSPVMYSKSKGIFSQALWSVHSCVRSFHSVLSSW
jgi:hypothetical protein